MWSNGRSQFDREILTRRIDLHARQARNKELGKRERRLHRAMKSVVENRLRQFDERREKRAAARKASRNANQQPASAHKLEILERRKKIAIVSMRLCARTINGLEEIGVLWVYELLTLTAGDVLAVPNFGDGALREIRRELKRLGLALREPAEGEIAPATSGQGACDLPLRRPAEKSNSNRLPQCQLRRRPNMTIENLPRKMIASMAVGASERQAARGISASGARWHASQAKRLIRAELERGATPEEIACKMGFLPGGRDASGVVKWIESLRVIRPGWKSRH